MVREQKSKQTESAQHAIATPFDFMELPLELRLMCYNHILGGSSKGSPTAVHIQQIRVPSRSQPLVPRGRSAQVLRTCRTIYDEALPILYSTHVFKSSHFRLLANALDSFGKRAQQHIKHIVIQHPCKPYVPAQSTLRREMRAVGVLPTPKQLPTLPTLPGLKTVKILLSLPGLEDFKSKPTAGEGFMSDLMKSQPQHGHFLRDYLHALRRSPQLKYTVRLMQRKGFYKMLPSIGPGRRRVHRQWVTDVELCMDLGVEYYVEEDKKRNREHWAFVGHVSNGEELAVKFRCRKDNNKMGEWEQIRTLRI